MIEEFEIVSETDEKYFSKLDLLYKEETKKLIGAFFEVHNELGRGFLEIIYKDALEIEFQKRGIPYVREKKYEVFYKDIKLNHFYVADFVVNDKIIIEVKAQRYVIEENFDQSINYLATSKCRLGLLVNFGEPSLKFKRLVL